MVEDAQVDSADLGVVVRHGVRAQEVAEHVSYLAEEQAVDCDAQLLAGNRRQGGEAAAGEADAATASRPKMADRPQPLQKVDLSAYNSYSNSKIISRMTSLTPPAIVPPAASQYILAVADPAKYPCAP